MVMIFFTRAFQGEIIRFDESQRVFQSRTFEEFGAEIRRYGHQQIIVNFFSLVGFDGLFLAVDLGDAAFARRRP